MGAFRCAKKEVMHARRMKRSTGIIKNTFYAMLLLSYHCPLFLPCKSVSRKFVSMLCVEVTQATDAKATMRARPYFTLPVKVLGAKRVLYVRSFGKGSACRSQQKLFNSFRKGHFLHGSRCSDDEECISQRCQGSKCEGLKHGEVCSVNRGKWVLKAKMC